MIQLAIETSSIHPSAALGRDGQILDTWRSDQPRAHAASLISSLSDLCRSNKVNPEEIQCVMVSIGPGSFTGLRIGVTVARTMSLAAARTGREIALVAVPSLHAVGCNALSAPEPPEELAVIADAKRNRVFATRLRREGDAYVEIKQACEIEPQKLFAECGPHAAVIGEGVEQHREAVEKAGLHILSEDLWRPRAESVFLLGCELATRGALTPTRELVPMYVRRPEAEERWEERNRA